MLHATLTRCESLSRSMRVRALIATFAVFICMFAGITIQAQTTEFTYQGSLKDNASLANANYDFEFALFDTPAGGFQIGATIPKNTVQVTNGLFAVKLDFGPVFPGANRYLEIRVKLTGQPNLTSLVPRQLVNSAPYSVKSLTADNAASAANAATATNAMQLGGVAANQYVLTGDARMTDARNPMPNSVNYIQNNPASPQTGSNFNISGTGTLGGGMNIDQANGNNGTVVTGNSLTFGFGSGEGIASKRNAGGKQYGLDFYTQFANRMSITSSGSVRIRPTNPTANLH